MTVFSEVSSPNGDTGLTHDAFAAARAWFAAQGWTPFAFQEAVWRELSRIPPGESVSYAVLAARAGRPAAVRAAGTACGSNQIAILIPCHRARRGDGTPGGYAYGIERKAKLLAKEGAPPLRLKA